MLFRRENETSKEVNMNNLKPIKTTERAKELGRRGGLSKSPSKVLASRINGSLANKDLTPEQRYMLSLLKEKQFVELITELIAMNLEHIHQPARRDKIIEQLSKFLPTKSINLELSAEEKSFTNKYEQFRDIVFDVCSEEQTKKIIERVHNEIKI